MARTEMLHKAVKGDARSITALVEQYTPLVHKIVNKYAWMSPAHSRDDLVQEGLLGVVKANRLPKYPLSLEQSDWSKNLEDDNTYEVKDDYPVNLVRDIVIAGCGSLDSKRAQIVCDRYGLLGKKPLRQGDVAKKYGMTKQAVNSHISRFSKIVREKHPELEALIK